LFDWLVEQVNKSLAVGKRRTGRSISILDIYGFESFEVSLVIILLWYSLCLWVEFWYMAFYAIYCICREIVLSNSA
jgi:hypothetical protein